MSGQAAEGPGASATAATMPGSSPLLVVEDLHVCYGNIAAVTGVSLTINRGEIVTVIGANGAGKSTLLRTIAGLNRARKGSVVMNGAAITAETPERLVA
jgi:branched-chain amino acid transport system ATP-binding protein